MSQRHLDVDLPHLLSVGDTERYLKAALEDIVTNYPPRSRYPPETLHGLWSGPTGVAYLLLQVSARRPELIIKGQSAEHWARAYIAPGSRGHNLRLGSHGCGTGDEKLAYEAVRCAVSRDLSDVPQFMSSVSQIMAVEDYPDEMLYGRAGTLYLLRMVRHWVPGSNDLVDPAISEISNTIMNRGPRWRWHGKRYLGAVHGDIGIVTQLVLTSPELASRLQPIVEKLLGVQLEDGNWPSSEESGPSGKGLVQFCHGATGFVLSLSALRPHFPGLHAEFNAAVKKGRECIWSQGLLKKEPCLCHGIFGNALALASGPQRDHFLAVATPENVARMKSSDPTVFERADYGRSYSSTSSYAPSAVWTWLVRQEEEPKMLGYSDV
ncbi:hypothetical protein N657DRAFT_583706 [Parathielavia appendiculata]|uniref:LanC-like protein 2 n=1 Tax=Parathielavia appendiculata TaxID=2587402 RepID=A0AAN6YYI9_9PEZI|nr:hypothetical protein N657DRAFT_583706 [Parathielavia appendiculata]